MISRRFPVFCAALVLLLWVGTAEAAFRVNVTRQPGFNPRNLSRLAVITTECHPVVDCTAIQQRVVEEISRVAPGLKLVRESDVRQFLFEAGHTAYDPEMRDALFEKFELSALIELVVPFAEKGDGFGGHRRSQVKVELQIRDREGKILVHGVGTGRPANVVSSPERVAGNVVEEIVRKLYGK